MAQIKNGDVDKIKELIELMERNGLLELEICHGNDKIFLKRCPPSQSLTPAVVTIQPQHNAVPAVQQVAGPITTVPPPEAKETQKLIEIKSPIVGTFYVTPSPDSEPYVEVGSQVEPQTVVCIIEAMKVMNEIRAETSGTIFEILAKNGQAVEYGQVLFRIKAD